MERYVFGSEVRPIPLLRLRDTGEADALWQKRLLAFDETAGGAPSPDALAWMRALNSVYGQWVQSPAVLLLVINQLGVPLALGKQMLPYNLTVIPSSDIPPMTGGMPAMGLFAATFNGRGSYETQDLYFLPQPGGLPNGLYIGCRYSRASIDPLNSGNPFNSMNPAPGPGSCASLVKLGADAVKTWSPDLPLDGTCQTSTDQVADKNSGGAPLLVQAESQITWLGSAQDPDSIDRGLGSRTLGGTFVHTIRLSLATKGKQP